MDELELSQVKSEENKYGTVLSNSYVQIQKPVLQGMRTQNRHMNRPETWENRAQLIHYYVHNRAAMSPAALMTHHDDLEKRREGGGLHIAESLDCSAINTTIQKMIIFK